MTSATSPRAPPPSGWCCFGFGANSAIGVVSAVALLWRLRARERRLRLRGGALYVVAITLFLLAAYITCQGISSLLSED